MKKHSRTTHGHYYEPEFRAWSNMRKRCSPKSPSYHWYAHVKVCEPWAASYEAFLADVGRRPSERHSLDRINPAGNYEPGNVRWADRATQSRNTRLHCTSKTGIRGVSWSDEKRKWRVAIYVDNRQRHVGYFDDLDTAAKARKEAEAKLWGNTPERQP